MTDYGFFVAHLRFVAAKTEASTPEIAAMIAELKSIADAVEADGAFSVTPERLRIAACPDEAERYRDGKTGLLGFFVGRVMKETRGKANPELVRKLLTEKLAQ